MQAQASMRVITAVSRTKNVDMTALPPLYEVIDPDALDALFSSHRDGDQPRSTFEVRFTYAGREVVLRSDGDVCVREPRPDPDPTAND